MKKLLFFITFSILFFMISCDDDVGLGSVPVITPENIFAGGEWESINSIIYNQVEIGQYFKVSFTETTFIFHRESGYPYYDETFTGTYSLLFDKVNGKMIKFVFDEPSLNGEVSYMTNISGYPEDTIMFASSSNPLFPIGGYYNKISQ